MRVSIRGWESINHAEVDVDGITVVVGSNTVGKSAFLRAVDSCIRNQSNESNINFLRDKFEIGIFEGDHSVKMVRRKTQSSPVTYESGGVVKQKTGSSYLSDIFPTFPLRCVEIKDSKFFPHLVKQKETPVFSQVDVYEFFSSMFSKISILSGEIQTQKKTIKNLETGIGNESIILDSLKSELNDLYELQKKYDGVDIALMERQNNERNSLFSQMQYVSSQLTSTHSFLEKYKRMEIVSAMDIKILYFYRLLEAYKNALSRYIGVFESVRQLQEALRYEELREKVDLFNQSTTKREQLESRVRYLKQEIEKAEAEERAAQEKVILESPKCPVCGQVLSEELRSDLHERGVL